MPSQSPRRGDLAFSTMNSLWPLQTSAATESTEPRLPIEIPSVRRRRQPEVVTTLYHAPRIPGDTFSPSRTLSQNPGLHPDVGAKRKREKLPPVKGSDV